jgi:hypothetical protein
MRLEVSYMMFIVQTKNCGVTYDRQLECNMFIVQATGVIFTTLYFLCNLQISPLSYSVCPYQAFPAKCNVTL